MLLSKKELKRIRQETAPATYMADFDKEKSCKIIEDDLNKIELMKDILIKWKNLLSKSGKGTKQIVRDEIEVVIEELSKSECSE